MSDWKPGDVAMVNDCTQPDKPWKLATCVAARTPECETTWRLHDTGGEVWSSVSEARPLVVIDPEDCEALDRLRHDLISSGWLPDNDADSLDDILRHFANPKPPRPDEPQGLGAVVEDADGNLWVRTDRGAPWSPIRGIGGQVATRRLWSELDVVRVLSEGVS